MNTYLIPGLGGDKRMYAGQLSKFSDTIVLEFIPPKSNESISEYALRLADGIDKTQPFIMIGVSLGGILTQEIAKVYKPHKSIVISSVKTRKELPLWIRFFKYFQIQKLIPGKVYLWAFMLLVWLKTLFSRSNHIIANLRNMAKDADPNFVYWAVDKVVKWQEPEVEFKPYHMHGNHDYLFPIRRIKNLSHEVEGGTHAMILTHVKEINTYLEMWING